MANQPTNPSAAVKTAVGVGLGAAVLGGLLAAFGGGKRKTPAKTLGKGCGPCGR